MTTKTPMTIGELKEALKRKPKEMPVRYDFAYFHPARVHSFRGFYDEPAIGYATDCDPLTVADVLELLEQLTTEQFTGYKGGEYFYRDDQILHVANAREACDTVITDVFNHEGDIVFETAVIA